MTRRLELVLLDELVPAATNPKDHDDEMFDQSIERFGYIEPIIRDDRTGRLISGHGRRERLIARRERGQAPPEGIETDDQGRWLVPVQAGWASRDDAEADAAVIALNRVGERGGWNKEPLAAMLAEMADNGGLAGVGYDRSDLDDLVAALEEEAAPPPPAPAEGQYADQQVRSVILNYTLPDYEAVVDLATEARQALGVDSTAEVFAALLNEWEASQ